MSGFSADWLALREPVDAAARCANLQTVVLDALRRSRSASGGIDVVDIGAGSGANLRYVAPVIEGAQRWLLVDNDAALLVAATQQLQSWGTPDCQVQTLTLDLATQLARLPLPAHCLLTASALLDLVSGAWLRELMRRAAAAGAFVWFALTYDGRIECCPSEPEDAEVRGLVNRHQLRDKGFGAALGPGAAQRVEQLLTALGYQVHSGRSDWHITPDKLELQQSLVEGWCLAATQIEPHRAAMLRSWLARRRVHIAAGRSELRVGHVDIVGLP